MADNENTRPGDDENQHFPPLDQPEPPAPDVHVELRDSLPGDRAVMGIEQEGEFVWLASRKYVHPKAVEEFEDQLQRIARQRWWVQNWPGAR